MNSTPFRFVAALVAAGLLSSCAAVKVRDIQTGHSAKASGKPRKVYVAPFSLADAKLKEHPMRKNPGQLGPEAQKLLADYLVSEISAHLAPAVLVSSPAAAGRDGWLISGKFTRINEGSRLLRVSIGLGAGGTKMETQAEVKSLPARRTLLAFGTSGGSGAMPGGLTNPIPFSGGPTAALQSRLGVSDDAARTARVITGRLLDYLGLPRPAGPGLVSKPKSESN